MDQNVFECLENAWRAANQAYQQGLALLGLLAIGVGIMGTIWFGPTWLISTLIGVGLGCSLVGVVWWGATATRKKGK